MPEQNPTKSSSWFGTPIHDPVHVMPFYVNNWSSYVGSTFVFLSSMKFVSHIRFEFFQHIHVQHSCTVGKCMTSYRESNYDCSGNGL